MANGLFNLKQVIQAVQQGAWVAQKPPAVEYLVVAGGGGGGGSYEGAGGGAGGLLQGIDPVPNQQTLLVTVGGGGTGGTAHSATVTNTNGSNSVFGSLTAIGGGKGGSAEPSTPLTVLNGSAGGSGGGGTRWSTSNGFGLPGPGTAGQGNNGGRSNANFGASGGGGGAGSVGFNGHGDVAAGNGGSGLASAISGTVTAYAGGGGGDSGSVRGLGGVGGGGGYEAAGTANTGGGGGGSRSSGNGGNGGSGVVFVSYPDTYAAATATTGSPTISTSGSGSISFNGSTQHLNYGDSTAFEFGSGDFTLETFIYVNSLTAGGSIIGKYRIADIGQSEFFFGYNTSGALYVYLCSTSPSNDETGFVSANGVITTGSWIHVAVTRASGAVKVFANGAVVASGTYNKTITSTSSSLRISALTNTSDDYSNFINAYLSNVRIVKGTALYTGTFTVPTAPLAVVSGTSLLLSSVSGAYLADSSTNSFSPASSSTALNSTVAGPWNQLSPFATGNGYKNRVYKWTASGSITF